MISTVEVVTVIVTVTVDTSSRARTRRLAIAVESGVRDQHGCEITRGRGVRNV
jgi:hypothetical protein